MAIKLNSMKNMLLEAAWKADNGTITSGDAAMCKYFCANAAFEVVDSAMQVLVALGLQAITVLPVSGAICALTGFPAVPTKCRS
jgi:alkylation response protein AidB-like acyl-CoA dehydrogenase